MSTAYDGKSDDELRAEGRGLVAAIHVAAAMNDKKGMARLRAKALDILSELTRRGSRGG